MQDTGNAGVGIGMEVFNGNPTNTSNALRLAHKRTGTTVFISNDDTAGSAVFILNAKTVLTAEPFETGEVGVFTIGNNNANSSPTLEAINGGTGSIATFFLDDELVEKANNSPAVNINTNGKGSGFNISIGNRWKHRSSNKLSTFRLRECGLFQNHQDHQDINNIGSFK